MIELRSRVPIGVLLALGVFVAFLLSPSSDGRVVPGSLVDDTHLLLRLDLEIDPVAGNVQLSRPRNSAPSFVRTTSAAVQDLNTSLQLTSIVNPPAGVTGDDGLFPITATFENISNDLLRDIYFQVALLEFADGAGPQPNLTNADRGGTGVGAIRDGRLPGETLAPGESFEITFDLHLPRLSPFSFFVNAFGEIVEPDNPAIQLDKSPEAQSVISGESADFEITVTNVGDTELTGVSVTDALTPDCSADIGTLAPTVAVTYSCTSGALETGFTNVALATGNSPIGEPVSDEDSAVVDVTEPDEEPPAITSVNVEPEDPTAQVGETVQLTVRAELSDSS